jgi:outer membrane protein OmpA-like peptidoglycan-associated protein
MNRLLLVFLLASFLVPAQDNGTFKSNYDQAEKLKASGQYAEAITAFRGAWASASDDKQSARATFRIGECYAASGDKRVAMEWMTKSLGYYRYPNVEEALKKLQLSEWSSPRSAEDIRGALLAPPGKGPALEDGVESSTDLEILFDFDKDTLKPEGKAQLGQLGSALASEGLKGQRFRIVGHTDKHGADDYNQQLSDRRARAVARYLAGQYSIDASHLDSKGMGKRQLRYPGDSEEDDRLNRRVEVQLLH